MNELTTEKEVIIYESEDGQIQFDVTLDKDTIWLTQNNIASIFDTTIQNVGQHIKSIFNDYELKEAATVKNFFIVQKEGSRQVKRKIDHYNLDAIISIGYRINSKRATKFRIWATSILKNHLIEGYTTNTKRLLEKHREIEVV
jgi:hypothetical protein